MSFNLKTKKQKNATDRDMLYTIKYTSLFWLSFKADISSLLASSMLCYNSKPSMHMQASQEDDNLKSYIYETEHRT